MSSPRSRHQGIKQRWPKGCAAPSGYCDRTAPTFHEIRSLSSRLYKAQGNVDTKQLLGHKSDASAALYADARGGWVTVSVK